MLDLEAVRIRLAELDTAINQQLPNYAVILNVIHKELQAQPELVYKLSDEEIAVIISGLGKFHKVEVIDVKANKPLSRKQGALLDEDSV